MHHWVGEEPSHVEIGGGDVQGRDVLLYTAFRIEMLDAGEGAVGELGDIGLGRPDEVFDAEFLVL